jgi:hypothetical protein
LSDDDDDELMWRALMIDGSRRSGGSCGGAGPEWRAWPRGPFAWNIGEK